MSGGTAQGGTGKGGAPQAGGTATGGIEQGGKGGAAEGGASKGGSTQGGSGGTAPNGGSAGATMGAAGSAASGGGGSTGTGGASTGGIPATGKPFVAQGPSCSGLSARCQGESCCTSISIPGGSFSMGRSQAGGDSYATNQSDELPEHAATVASFALDKYEVTVGRFRKFIAAYDQWYQAHPAVKDGSNPNTLKTGWGESWTPSASDLPTSAANLTANLKCSIPMYQTWSDSEGANDMFAINCVNWFEAFAFCIWDGGRLPTEAEWEYTAAGGGQDRLYPWGSDAPTEDRVFLLTSDFAFNPVGSKPLGVGYFGHLDLAGSMWELVFDWYSATYYGTSGSPSMCDRCANTEPDSLRSRRGGSWNELPAELRAANRFYAGFDSRSIDMGFRCARPAQ